MGPRLGLRNLLAWIVAAAAALGLAPEARAADEPAVVRLRAERLAGQGRCAEALPLLRQVREASPEDARAALLEGECAINLRRYADAIAPLERARELDPQLGEADLYLAIARYHQGELDRAERELDAAAARLPDRAELHLYRGLILLERAESRSAAGELERAGALDPARVEPVASYFAGLAWAGAEERERAVAALRRVRDQAAGTVWADEAERALQRIEERERRRAWIGVTGGVEYDDNVVLRGSGVQLPSEISQASDLRAVWGLDAGSEIFRTARWAGGVLATYVGSLHEELGEFDTHYPLAGLWLDRRLDEATFLRVETDFGYAWVDEEPYLAAHGATASLQRDWGEAGTGQGFVRFARHNYLFPDVDEPPGPPGINAARERNRDGNEFTAGFDYLMPILDTTRLRAGYEHQRFDARGREYSYAAHAVRVGVSQDLPLGFGLDLFGSYTYRPYRHASTFPNPPGSGLYDNNRRRDDVWRFSAILEKALGEHVTLWARYSYLDNDSNVSVFDYRREIIGAYVTVRFQN